ncbi:MAG: hypothetical protein BroJett025_10100 [Patescibacteria group bacterium]|nr:MAG: hypothetical protein BroJett025_10100 [Patescibacteria group bacterium]
MYLGYMNIYSFTFDPLVFIDQQAKNELSKSRGEIYFISDANESTSGTAFKYICLKTFDQIKPFRLSHIDTISPLTDRFIYSENLDQKYEDYIKKYCFVDRFETIKKQTIYFCPGK